MARHAQRNIAIVAIVLSVSTFVGIFFFGSNIQFEGEVASLALLSTTDTGVQNCRMWNVMTEVGVDGDRRTYSPVTRTFDIFTTNELISGSSTVGTIRLIDTSVRVRCDPAISDVTFRMTGGTVVTSFYATQENGQETFISSTTRQITTIPRDILNRDVIIPTGTVTADLIDSKLTSTTENYITRIRAEVKANMLFVGSETGTATNSGEGIVQGKLTVKVHNEILDPPTPTSNVVDLTFVGNDRNDSPIIDIAEEFSTIRIEVRGQLPQWSASEGVPNYDIFTPDGRLFQANVLMNIVRLIDSSTNTHEFIDSQFAIGTNPATGFWKVEMHSNQDIRKTITGSPSIDVKTFKVVNSAPQATFVCSDGTIVSSSDQCPSLPPTGELDSDGDGIPDVDDDCPNEIGLARFNGCPEDTPTKPTSQQLIDDLLKGEIVNVGTITFSDASEQVIIGKGGLTTIEDFISQTGQVSPLQLTATIESEEKVIDRIEYEVLYVFPTTVEAIATELSDSDIVFQPTTFVSSTQQKSGMTISQTGAVIGGSGGVLQRGEEGDTFFGFSLGSVVISASEFESLSRDFIGDGNAREVTLIIDSKGTFDMTRSTLGIKETAQFNLVDSFVSFSKLTINNEVNSGIKKCQEGTIPEYDIDNKIIKCSPPETITTQTCFTSLRPEGFTCSQSFINNNCPTGIATCNEPDRDGDGFPDLIDTICPSLAEDGLGTLEQRTDGCPLGKEFVDPCENITTGICKPPNGNGNDDETGGCAVASIDPRLCPPDDLDTTTLLIIGGIGLLILGIIIIAVRRRRSQVFGV